MTLLNIFLCFICVVGVTIGQVLMKKASIIWNQVGILSDPTVVFWVGCAFLIYGLASIGWLYILRGVPLSSAYPFLAITYLIIPIADYLFFDQKSSWLDIIAILLIVLGIFIISANRRIS